jgi:hypothetical protein
MLLTVFSLSADTVVTVTFTGAPYGNDSPYDLTVGTTAVLGTCISGTDAYINKSDVWQADVETIKDYSDTTTPPYSASLTEPELDEMAWLTTQFVLPVPPSSETGAEKTTDTAIQQAIWYIAVGTGGGGVDNSYVGLATTTVAGMTAAAVKTLENQFEVLVPTVPNNQNNTQGSQVFLIPNVISVTTPEPGTLLLVGLALLGLGISRKRKAARAV